MAVKQELGAGAPLQRVKERTILPEGVYSAVEAVIRAASLEAEFPPSRLADLTLYPLVIKSDEAAQRLFASRTPCILVLAPRNLQANKHPVISISSKPPRQWTDEFRILESYYLNNGHQREPTRASFALGLEAVVRGPRQIAVDVKKVGNSKLEFSLSQPARPYAYYEPEEDLQEAVEIGKTSEGETALLIVVHHPFKGGVELKSCVLPKGWEKEVERVKTHVVEATGASRPRDNREDWMSRTTREVKDTEAILALLRAVGQGENHTPRSTNGKRGKKH